MHAEVCPICKGSGKYTQPINHTNTTTTGTYAQCTCHGCMGKGWVSVRDEDYSPYTHPYTFYNCNQGKHALEDFREETMYTSLGDPVQ